MAWRPHGTRTKYVHDGCRCTDCRAAAARYERNRVRRRTTYRLRHVGGGWWLVLHRYRKHELFRSRDRDAAAAVCQRLNDDADNPAPLWASSAVVAQVRRHIAGLRAAGFGLPRLARLTGLARSRILEMADGRGRHRDRPRRRRLKTTTADRILAVRLDAPHAPGAAIDGAETWRQIDALRAAGWTRSRIALALGAQTPRLQLARERVLQATADKIRRLYEQHAVSRGTVPPDHEGRSSGEARP